MISIVVSIAAYVWTVVCGCWCN